MENRILRFKISGIMMFIATLLLVLTSRNSELIMGISNTIVIAIERIMICDFISLFMVVFYLFVFVGILPSLTLEVVFCLE